MQDAAGSMATGWFRGSIALLIESDLDTTSQLYLDARPLVERERREGCIGEAN